MGDRALNIDNMEDFLVARVRGEDPDVEVRPFTAVHDLVIKIDKAILLPFADAIEEIEDTKSLAQEELLLDEDVDLLVENLLISRRVGNKASGTVRVYFSEPTSVTFIQGQAFLSRDGLRFVVPVTTSINSFTMQSNVEGNLFYVDVQVVADSESEAGSVAKETIVDIEGGPEGVVQVTNKEEFEDGADRETNTELIARARKAVSVRDLVTENSISTVLLEAFPTVLDLNVVGYGDDEMIRDELTGTGISLGGLDLGDASQTNIGGKVDIYIRPTSTPEKTKNLIGIKEITKLRARDGDDPDGPLKNVTFDDGFDRPVVDLVKIEELDPASGLPTGVAWVEGTDFSFESENAGLTFSVRDRMLIRVLDTSLVGTDVRVTYRTADIVETVQDYVDTPSRRVLTADLLVRHVVPATVDMTIPLRMSGDSELTEEDIEEILETYIDDLKVGEDLEISDVIDLLYENRATFVDLDAKVVTVKVIDVDGTRTTTTVTSVYDPAKNVGYLPGTITVSFL